MALLTAGLRSGFGYSLMRLCVSSFVHKGLAISDFDLSLKLPKVLQYSGAYNILPICSLSTGSVKEHCMIIRKKYISNTSNQKSTWKYKARLLVSHCKQRWIQKSLFVTTVDNWKPLSVVAKSYVSHFQRSSLTHKNYAFLKSIKYFTFFTSLPVATETWYQPVSW